MPLLSTTSMNGNMDNTTNNADASSIGITRVDFIEDLDKVMKQQHQEESNVTPATSASSSPSLPPTNPPPHVHVPSCFEQLNGTTITTTACEEGERSWVAPASRKSLRTHNPIRAIVDPIMATSIKSGEERGDGKDQISLALGDPTAYGNLPPCPAIISAITNAIQSPSIAAGYVNACGTPEAREAIAKHHSNLVMKDLSEEDDGIVSSVRPDDVIVANGSSGALELALTALLDESSVLLVPRPGFPLYQVIAESHGAAVAHYDLLPNNCWECDLDHMESIIFGTIASSDDKKVVRGIIVNNPSNPTGAVYSEEHLMQIVKLAEKYQVPIIADEIYGDMTFGCNVFHPMANVVAKMGYAVPVITASGLGKQYLVPGWRLGWIVFQDSHNGAIQEVKNGAQRLAQVVLGSSHLAQVAIPAVLNPSNESDVVSTALWKSAIYSTIEEQANLLCGLLNECHGLGVIFPEGAMYAMVRIEVDKFDDLIIDDVSFMKLLLEEENIVVLPGCAFGLVCESDANEGTAASTYVFRVVFCAPKRVLRTASERISSFCLRHKRLD
mmetsp:Transcript_13610/g.29607  ORF Transcript_13610/g.29607 Transcript_13610/m.29607 type:complete len:556 (-) Transcript_13610:148-1815(-)|eukprot:CAMPEP_0172326426 /NCGR_PEP_ID=MMETSP1058-20130122/56502_1 /TAXON_ID=83371 /ORGANISM="Detonula confervacea, Strain CCMP 353" /LENGTH=555 /DNA_ID=CAMNT_0013043203 /DNA_START=95 /DNA_END=1762 /DNA_ORIENTATION=-